ncbi:Por secretion system C-terminal sorting domain-containing protein [Catalinimonas alkaloidigena]|uniref:Por secretion system C-terminal sorting domain-containing protein n=1 Tax=Catalinimonas alkaloidigena TaxID=1075417 RepID=A0A1G9EZR6_9BACT|nr:T9SS type A sorting domain-containing protein [Catalinimonas alkaloidigena]SDK81679.1 Por secretion system C-terminal sorting domain-containing protein [Catalinimonas alkaloidigena]
MRKLFTLFLLLATPAFANHLLIPMDEAQTNHLKAYGVTFQTLKHRVPVYWLLNYRGGSFLLPERTELAGDLRQRQVAFEVLTDEQAKRLRTSLDNDGPETTALLLSRAPRIALYQVKGNVTGNIVESVLSYAEIPFEEIRQEDVLEGKLDQYDWVHVHHEDFTGQHGKFHLSFKDQPWYKTQYDEDQAIASQYGFANTPQLKGAVARRIRNFCQKGGFLFAMCAGTDTYDIALATEGLDVHDVMYDGDSMNTADFDRLDFTQTFAFQNFQISQDWREYEFSTIDHVMMERRVSEKNDTFQLHQFSAQLQPVAAMLTQNHQRFIKGFMGQTTAFKKTLIKPEVTVLAEPTSVEEARMIYGNYGQGHWVFLGGHDPEDYQHLVGDPDTDISQHPNSPGYRLILNNVLLASSNLVDISGTLTAYPNPAADQLHLTFSEEQTGDWHLRILDSMGKNWHKAEFERHEATQPIDLTVANLPAGIYFVEISQGRYRATQKVIKQ